MLTSLASNVAVEPGEDQVAVLELFGFAFPKNEVAELLRHGRGLLPPDSILVLLAKGAVRGTNGVKLQEWVL